MLWTDLSLTCPFGGRYKESLLTTPYGCWSHVKVRRKFKVIISNIPATSLLWCSNQSLIVQAFPSKTSLYNKINSSALLGILSLNDDYTEIENISTEPHSIFLKNTHSKDFKIFHCKTVFSKYCSCTNSSCSFWLKRLCHCTIIQYEISIIPPALPSTILNVHRCCCQTSPLPYKHNAVYQKQTWENQAYT